MSTSSNGQHLPRRRTSLGWLLVISIVFAAVSVIFAMWLTGGAQERTVAELLEPYDDMHPVEDTSELCHVPGCADGWRTDVGVFLRFDSTGEAEYWETVLGDDGRRWEHFVLDFSEHELSMEDRRRSIDVLYSWHDWN